MRRATVLVGLVACRTTDAPAVAIPAQPAASAMVQSDAPRVAPQDAPAGEPEPFVAGTQRCGWADPARVGRPAGPCSNDGPPAPACGPEGPCAPCAALQHYRPRVATRALACVRRLPADDGCSDCSVRLCIDEARKAACDDPAATEPCVRIGFKCRAVGMTECRMYLSGMTDAARAKMVECLSTPAGCGFGIHECAEKI